MQGWVPGAGIASKALSMVFPRAWFSLERGFPLSVAELAEEQKWGRNSKESFWGVQGRRGAMASGAEPGLSPQNSTLTIEEFHAKLQEATNFPLRPFVIPFLKVGAAARGPRGCRG